MKLATRKCAGKLDGELLVVSRDMTKAVSAAGSAPNLQYALDHWKETELKLQKLYSELNAGSAKGSFDFNEADCLSPLPRAYQFLDGSAYIQHIVLVRKARNAELPATLKTVPLMYQGLSDRFLAPNEDIPFIHESHGLDFEGEVCVVTDFVPMGTKENEAHSYIRMFMLCNDVSLRGLIPAELAQGFGFLQSKPASAFSPLAVTPDELGAAWKNGRVCLPLESELNGEFFGNPDAGEMFFSFGKLIEHAARTRNLAAGTILGSGTVSNEDQSRGSSCLAEKRMLEQITEGKASTPFMKPGDTIQIQMRDSGGKSIFGRIHQKVVQSSIRED
ncbi:MAG: 2-keto-4-pentenoate hydratase [Deltaproteobacteria bacterium CG11_big_fil_rev_8_21_14_0_20_45_16]|nr:MAG: 2-keto-4-pentenoate hydratase [Deltaproteobacteria bacterium CG11_big_fil_rev_8_21_14_0_20_45_16]